MSVFKHFIPKLIIWITLLSTSFATDLIVNDITLINPIKVKEIVFPKSANEVSQLIKKHNAPISIGGGRFSQGGQIATDNTLFIDMRHMNHIVSLDKENHLITVESGITWREIQELIDKYDLSLKIMQSFSNFTVGGSLSVNAHGRYVNEGAIIRSVDSIKMVLADGEILTASRKEHSDIFFGAIGGYGGLGVIVEATLSLTDNTPIERIAKRMKLSSYKDYFLQNIRYSHNAIFHNADLYPPNFEYINAITWVKTNKPVTIKERLAPQQRPLPYQEFLLNWISDTKSGKYFRQIIYDRYANLRSIVEWRNYEASYDVNSIEPASRKTSTYVLQEYFIPTDHFDSFTKKMVTILKKNQVNVLNISIRQALPDHESYLSWARTEVFSFVIYYKQGVTNADKSEVKKWTSLLIDAALEEGGTYYLPYQIVATNEQFLKAYPGAKKFFKLKSTLDPQYKFRNKLFDHYYTKTS
ncbi:FAD-binding oxidoreductase [Legionella fallonii]|uniref:D-arabinono-1,4-lactone oxidase n=1 Tax=Legionella fallonii LLAP-10 TaxID=1212491 RepID=A0A098G1S3_9GAMM|nr:FAD-binding oxidoreductase [Legionella fallonii]CEG55931.1 D-arabinono-1,4-lactone oxidase [Legionella fallonii LLAP-10]